ncbi:hypothetical protein AB0F81_35990 [Actinoplanes sp. NPDC024001]|uniref:hypothetical protein n=1 Tax=Actinoplanes sp. NPDC024001 TaxID=3154598 RepID=UPI0033CFECB3
MTTSDWPQADPTLERAYKRLLRAYPSGYRRRHEREIVTTLLEMAEPGQQRPARADVWHLLASGVRQRFRLPAGRPLAWVFAVLALLIGGALGAAAGSWAATRTFAGVPDAAAGQALQRQIVGSPGIENHYHADSGSPWWDETAWHDTQVQGFGGWDPEQARQNLAADGWQLGEITHPPGKSATMDENGNTVELRTESNAFLAERDGVTLDIQGWTTEMYGSVTISMYPSGNAALLPLVVLGMLAGMAAGWLAAAALIQRARQGAPGRARLAVALGTLTVLALALPAVAFYGNVMRAFRYAGNDDPVFTVHSALRPGPYWPFGPEWLNLALAGAGLVLLVALVLTARVRPAPAAETQTVTS